MFTIKFNLEWFSSDLASSSESFVRVGTERIRVRKIDEGNYGPLDGYATYVAKSRAPFVIIVSRRGDGGNAHMDGLTRVLVTGATSVHLDRGRVFKHPRMVTTPDPEMTELKI